MVRALGGTGAYQSDHVETSFYLPYFVVVSIDSVAILNRLIANKPQVQDLECYLEIISHSTCVEPPDGGKPKEKRYVIEK